MTGKNEYLAKFGFSFERGGAHTSRTMMLAELRTLLAFVENPDAGKGVYSHAIKKENCLGKRSMRTRALSYRHLVDLYSLDRANVLFRALLYFWNRDASAQPLLALLCSYARDPILRSSAPFILKLSERAVVSREPLEDYIESLEAGRFSKVTLQSIVRNVCSTWTQSGHLQGSVQKKRTHPTPSVGSIAYALLLGYLTGTRGQTLFQTEYAKLLDCIPDRAIELTEEASRKGWIVFKRLGNVIEVLFPNLISQEEMEWLREQN
jgi:hypothetical protein